MEISKEEILANAGNFTKWNYQVPDGLLSATGYEDVKEIRKYSTAQFHAADEAEQNRMIQEVTDVYENLGIFPIRYFSENGIYSEIRKAMNFDASFDGDIISTGASVGTMLCSYLFPNLYKTPTGQDYDPSMAGGNSAWDKFYNRETLEKVVAFCFRYETVAENNYPDALMGGIRMTGSVPTNFRPMNAKAVFDRFTKPGDRVWDYSSGFGGRMLGALTSSHDLTYIGTDPNTETMHNLHRLGGYIESETGRTNSYELHCQGSEQFEGEDKSIDFAFASPPYFSLEMYGIDGGDFNNGEQSWQKYPEIEEWLEEYVRATIRNIYRVLKKYKHYAVNIADFNMGGVQYNYVDEWRRISEEEGFVHSKDLYLGARARTGSALLSATVPGMEDRGSMKTENIMVFKKK